MKNTGMTRPVDVLGRVVLPIELRRTRNINKGDMLEIFVDGEHIILRKYVPGEACAACGEMKELVTVGSIQLCRSCAAAVGKAK